MIHEASESQDVDSDVQDGLDKSKLIKLEESMEVKIEEPELCLKKTGCRGVV